MIQAYIQAVLKRKYPGMHIGIMMSQLPMANLPYHVVFHKLMISLVDAKMITLVNGANEDVQFYSIKEIENQHMNLCPSRTEIRFQIHFDL